MAAARQIAAQTNAQLESGGITLNFEPIDIAELRDCWLAHHEQA